MGDFKTFETERLLLKPTSIADADFIYELLNSPKWLQFIGDRRIGNREDAEEYIHKRMLPQLQKLGFSNYTVIRKEDGAKLGSCGLYDREDLTEIDLGFAFLPAFEGKGYAFEAASKLMNAAYQEFKLQKLQAIALQENSGSRRLLEKLGFQFKKLIKIPNDSSNLMLFETQFNGYS